MKVCYVYVQCDKLVKMKGQIAFVYQMAFWNC